MVGKGNLSGGGAKVVSGLFQWYGTSKRIELGFRPDFVNYTVYYRYGTSFYVTETGSTVEPSSDLYISTQQNSYCKKRSDLSNGYVYTNQDVITIDDTGFTITDMYYDDGGNAPVYYIAGKL